MIKEHTTLPKFPANRWWQLRKKFKQTLPKSAVNAQFLSTVFQIGEKAASNLVPALRQLGILDDENKPTDLANQWRHDDTYPAACKSMLEHVYPDALRDLAPGPDVDRAQAASWIAKQFGVGEDQSTQTASLYALIANGDPTQEPEERPVNKTSPKITKPRDQAPGTAVVHIAETNGKATAEAHRSEDDPRGNISPKKLSPTVHLDIQIHISPESTQEQIDKIFESMGKYIFASNVAG